MLGGLLICLGLKKKWTELDPVEVARHNTPESLWIVAGDAVYDITRFLNEHPGGSGALVKRGGGVTDCTRDFNFHSAKGRAMWDQYQIGIVNQKALARLHKESSTKLQTRMPPLLVTPTSCSSAASVPMQTKAEIEVDVVPDTPMFTHHSDDGGEECCCTTGVLDVNSNVKVMSQQRKVHCRQCACPDRAQGVILEQ